MKEKDIAYDAVKAFFSFKINKDGIMAVSEVSELFEKIGHDLKEHQIENIFKDLNGDFGTSFGRIDFKEFYIAFLFAKIDKDNSGGISPAEVKVNKIISKITKYYLLFSMIFFLE